ncbi:hypothetical protein DRW42_05970 [Pedobacter miscanthi]|uniref:Uncharacterized protein n=1 Tax=Pedobacter miscanthi TaxID=2259170 RepID=A0A366LA20_9SPHI|nr:hypothetical protein DRW42_05970 [Pedobacter miscanthi]
MSLRRRFKYPDKTLIGRLHTLIRTGNEAEKFSKKDISSRMFPLKIKTNTLYPCYNCISKF